MQKYILLLTKSSTLRAVLSVLSTDGRLKSSQYFQISAKKESLTIRQNLPAKNYYFNQTPSSTTVNLSGKPKK